MSIGDREMIEVRVTLSSGSVCVRSWNWEQVEAGRAPKIASTPAPWMLNARKEWPDPQGPITFSFDVDAEHDAKAQAWLSSL